ncbi:peptidase M61 [Mangrovimonas sp. DI 80]|uniref:M61 family metallopeptidase n=1 Tax=Mangrovimonas sp. DI 80 TaxID=1779330 RepID=UPI000976100B|nr:peptidase M61 [Mangrovimonas sp. DI 80]OMP30640.1 peptidase M61 [Mangrovimonas sp. DI 80]
MKKVMALIGFGMMMLSCGSSPRTSNELAVSNPIESSMDLTAVVNDKVPVTINPGRFTQDTVTYRLPRVVQGTYDISDFGAFVDDFKALDYDGKSLPVEKVDKNTWVITNATQLDKLTYWVNDSFDVESNPNYPNLFSPGGTNIEPNNYVLNLHGFIGYFDSLKNNQYTLDVVSPANFERTSALQKVAESASANGEKMTTSYFAPRYFDITDNPMMYGKLDVEEFMVGDIKIVLSVYSPNKKHTAESLKETMYKMMEAQKNYLGSINSTPRYDIYLYLSDGSAKAPKGFGALEHHTSTVVVLREWDSKESLAQSMVDVVSHEFFHIVTPLTVHSEDIHYFDYNTPTFSKHLWMYEGVTEYFAQHFQVYEGLVTPRDFFGTMDKKIDHASYFNDALSFTEMSENITEEPYAYNYVNVYQKGALIGMCMDILMREESDGTRSMLSLIKELSSKYGKDKPFEDDSIIDEISNMTYPSVAAFLQNHVVGSVPINYDEFFEKVGLYYEETKVATNYVQAANGLVMDRNKETEEMFFTDNVEDNSFWKEQGVQPGDKLVGINGFNISDMNIKFVVSQIFAWETGKEVDVTLDRNGETIEIKTTLTPAFTTSRTLVENPNATKKQIALRNAWLNQSENM